MLDLNLKTAIYIRVSTEEQAKEGFSINAQKEKLKQYALAKDWQIIDFYVDDGISGKNIKDRPELNRLLLDVKSGRVDNVLVYKIDRLTRSTKDLIDMVEFFNKKDCAFNSLMESIDTTSATGRMFLKIVGIFAEFERENLAERVAFGYEQKTREGNYTNTNGVYGYDYIPITGALEVNEGEKKTVNWIFESYVNGLSMSKICQYLISNEVPTKRGGTWSTSTIKSILTNPLYIGKVRYDVKNTHNKGFTVDSNHNPIVSNELFELTEQIISKRKKYNARHYPSENTIFTGALFCGKCGAKMGATQHKRFGDSGELYVNYYCYNRKNGSCDNKIISQNRLEQAFTSYLSSIGDFSTEGITLEKLEENGNNQENKEKRLAEIQKEIAKLEKRLSEIKDLFLKDKLTFEEYHEFTEVLKTQYQSLKTEIETMSEVEEEQKLDMDAVKKIIGNLKINWENLTNNEKRQFVSRFISRLTVYSKDKNLHIDLEFYNIEAKTAKEINLTFNKHW